MSDDSELAEPESELEMESNCKLPCSTVNYLLMVQLKFLGHGVEINPNTSCANFADAILWGGEGRSWGWIDKVLKGRGCNLQGP